MTSLLIPTAHEDEQSPTSCHHTQYVYDRLVSIEGTIRVIEILPGDERSPLSLCLHQVWLPTDELELVHPPHLPDRKPLSGRDTISPTEYMSQAFRYTALSYTWGSPNAQKCHIWLDGKPFMISPNLHAALLVLRERNTENATQGLATTMFWVDAICINQDDVYEKSRQVAQMGRIYRLAHDVIIWLGIFDEVEQQGLRQVQIQRLQEDASPQRVPLDMLRRLLHRDYWHRAWIVQEVSLATSIRVFCSNVILEWADLIFICNLVNPASLSVQSAALNLVRQRSSAIAGNHELFNQTLETLIIRYHNAQCQDARDRIFAFLSLAADCAFAHGIVPDYGIQRLTLLVKVLRHCRPTNPLYFIPILFRALTTTGNDIEWKTAADLWNTACDQARNMVGVRSGRVDKTLEQDRVFIIHFITAASASRSWIRSYTFEAALGKAIEPSPTIQSPGTLRDLIELRANGTQPMNFSQYASEHDSEHMSVLIGQKHIGVFSTSTLTTAASPCAVTGIHGTAKHCSAMSCALRQRL